MSPVGAFCERYFGLSEHGTDVRTEIIAGVTTFLTMGYIIAVNPMILSAAGMDKGALITATCLAASLSCILMGLYANLPLALASGMGLNAFFAYSVVIGMKVPWQVALAAVFVEGLIFIVLTLTNVREKVVNAIPLALKVAVSAGIGFFIAFIGLNNAKMVVPHKATLLTLGHFTDPRVLICCFGLLMTAVMMQRGIKGAILWGILACTLISWGYGYNIGPEAAAKVDIFLPSGAFEVKSIAPIFGQLSFQGISFWAFLPIVVTLLFVDFFDTVGTLVGVATKAKMLDKDGNFPGARKALLVDAVGTTAGAVLGVSTVTTYVESAAGVAEGGRTGLAAVISGVLFFVAMFFAPIVMAIPACATAPALILVGYLMMQSLGEVDLFDYGDAIPAFLTIIMMPLTYSIANGLIFGVTTFAILNILGGRKDRVSWTLRILAVLFIIRLVYFPE